MKGGSRGSITPPQCHKPVPRRRLEVLHEKVLDEAEAALDAGRLDLLPVFVERVVSKLQMGLGDAHLRALNRVRLLELLEDSLELRPTMNTCKPLAHPPDGVLEDGCGKDGCDILGADRHRLAG